MELRHLRYFVAVAEELHVGRAAARLHMAQPPLSQQIRNLEQELGVSLFHRVHRRITLTDAGVVFLQGARRVLADAEQAAEDARRAARGEIGRLTLGFVQSATFAALPRLLGAFRRACPGVALQLESMTTLEQVAALRSGTIQVGLLRPPLNDRGVAQLSVSRDPLVAALAADHPLAAQEQVWLHQLANDPMILYRRASGPGVHDTIVTYCRAAGFEPVIVQECDEVQTIAALVAAGLGVSLLIGPTGGMSSTGVVYKPVADDLPRWDLALAWRGDNQSSVLERFLSIARNMVGEPERIS